MLTPVECLDEINKALCQTSGWIALDLSNGNYLSKVLENVSGKDGMYIFRVRNKMTIVVWADSDQEAINKANHK